jgi:aldehyde:ferredoxin oxidoreductase
MGLAEATSPIGGSHMRAQTAYFELFGVPKVIGHTGIDDKARLVRIWQDMTCILDCTGVCYFFAVRCFVDPVLEVTPTPFTEFLNAVTGANYTVEEVRMAGERVFNAERLFLNNAGLSRKDDTLPKRQLEEPMPDGPNKGSLSRLPEMLDDYYELRGWDKNGIPSDEKLAELGLKK